MNYIDHTLSNIVLPKGAEPLGGWDLYIKTPEGSVCAPEINGCLLQGSVDFFTYFNACSLAKWKKYAGIKRVYLHLEFANEAINKEYAWYDPGSLVGLIWTRRHRRLQVECA